MVRLRVPVVLLALGAMIPTISASAQSQQGEDIVSCVFHAMPVADFAACRSPISRHAGRSFHVMPVARREADSIG